MVLNMPLASITTELERCSVKTASVKNYSKRSNVRTLHLSKFYTDIQRKVSHTKTDFSFEQLAHRNNPYPPTPQHGFSDLFVNSFHSQYLQIFFCSKLKCTTLQINRQILFIKSLTYSLILIQKIF